MRPAELDLSYPSRGAEWRSHARAPVRYPAARSGLDCRRSRPGIGLVMRRASSIPSRTGTHRYL